ncbi:MAG: hypothetical protein AB1689_02880 [Thermodesulfobacteriota bacterium]
MVVTILLVADEDADAVEPARAVEVSRTVDVRTDGPSWEAELVGAIGDHARDTARCLLGQLGAPSELRDDRFVPLATLLPVLEAIPRR